MAMFSPHVNFALGQPTVSNVTKYHMRFILSEIFFWKSFTTEVTYWLIV